MHVLVAPCTFKGSLTASEAASAIAAGLREARPELVVAELPIADGGEGTRALLADATSARTEFTRVPTADGSLRDAPVSWLTDTHALFDSAAVAGLPAEDRRDPFSLSTAGVGALTTAALDDGATTIEIGLGGTGTTDGGLGFLTALGARATDGSGADCPPGGAALLTLAHLDITGLDPRLARVRLLGLCDVDNRLLGPRGARMFMRQKGADAAACDRLEDGLGRLVALASAPAFARAPWLAADPTRAPVPLVAQLPGAGAAGGLGFAIALAGGHLLAGAERTLDLLHADEALAAADIVMTGEGRIDEQTAHGKAPAVLARRARSAGKRVIALAGSRASGAPDAFDAFDAIYTLTDDGTPTPTAVREAGLRLTSLAKRVAAELI